MKKSELEKKYNFKYININFAEGYPSGKGLFYECQKCKDIIDSNVDDNIECECGNIFVDVSSARFCVENDKLISLIKILPKNKNR